MYGMFFGSKFTRNISKWNISTECVTDSMLG
jgi:hypothetical protein